MSDEPVPASTGVTAAPMVTRLHAVIRGRVLGVGFRYWMHHTAERFNGKVKGMVRNTVEGYVETELESTDRGLLEAILQEMHQGPSGAHVEQVAADWETDVAPRYTGAFRVA
jgi:acylphosphatase